MERRVTDGEICLMNLISSSANNKRPAYVSLAASEMPTLLDFLGVS